MVWMAELHVCTFTDWKAGDISPVVSSSGGIYATVPCMSVSTVQDSPDTKQVPCKQRDSDWLKGNSLSAAGSRDHT